MDQPVLEFRNVLTIMHPTKMHYIFYMRKASAQNVLCSFNCQQSFQLNTDLR